MANIARASGRDLEAQTPEDLLLVDEASELLRQPVSTLRTWRSEGRGPLSFRIGRRVMYRRGDIDDWLEQQRRLTGRGGAVASDFAQ